MLSEAVVFPAPLQPLIMYSFLSCMLKGRELYSYSKLRVAANVSMSQNLRCTSEYNAF